MSPSFFEGQKALVDRNVCSKLIGECWQFFGIADRYIRDVKELKFLGQVTGSHSRFRQMSSPSFDTSVAERLRDTLVGADESKVLHFSVLKKLFANTTKLSTDDVNRRNTNAKLLCERYVSISGDPWVMVLDRAVSTGTTQVWLTDFTKNIITKAKSSLGLTRFNKLKLDNFMQINAGYAAVTAKYNRQLSIPRASSKETSRFLKELDGFEADLTVLECSLSNSAVTSAQTNGGKRPMNMSLTFP